MDSSPPPTWLPPPQARPHERSHCRHAPRPIHTVQTSNITHGEEEVQNGRPRKITTSSPTVPRSTSIRRPIQGTIKSQVLPPLQYARKPQRRPSQRQPDHQRRLFDLPMTSWTDPALTENEPILWFPDVVMRWTMGQANSVSRKKRAEYLAGMADVEANMTSEKENELMRLFDDVDSEDEQGFGRDVDGKGKGKEKEESRRRARSGIDQEDWEIVGEDLPRTSLSSDLPKGGKPRGGLGESSKIHGIGFPVQHKNSSLMIREEEGKQLPPTPEELTAIETQREQTAFTGEENADGSSASSFAGSSSRVSVPAHGGRTRVKRTWNSPPEQKQSESPDLGWPHVNDLFADLPDPITPVFRNEDLTYPIPTIWNRPQEDHWWLSTEHQTEEPTGLETHTNEPKFFEAQTEQQPSNDRPSSTHSSANDNPPSDLLVLVKNSQFPEPEDPGIFLRPQFRPILDFIDQEWKTTRILYRHLKSTLLFSPPTSPDGSLDTTLPPVLLTRDQRQIRIALTKECRQHLFQLKKWYANTKKCMDLVVEKAQDAAAFRFAVESDPETLLSEIRSRAEPAGDGKEEVEATAGRKEKKEPEKVVGAKRDLTERDID